MKVAFDPLIEVWEGRHLIQYTLNIVAFSKLIQYPLSDHMNRLRVKRGVDWLCPIILKVLEGWRPCPSCVMSNMVTVCDYILGERQLLDKYLNDVAQISVTDGLVTEQNVFGSFRIDI
jgi:hypothetical protein